MKSKCNEKNIKNRIEWVDTAKAIGIFLVFYGHMLFTYSFPDRMKFSFFLQSKLINSFHVPLFFFLSGFVYKSNNLGFLKFFKKKYYTRIVPVYFFYGILLFIFFYIDFSEARFQEIKGYVTKIAVLLLMGIPEFSWTTWFLVCLFTTELICFFVFKIVKDTKSLVLSMLFFLILSYIMYKHHSVLIKNIGIPGNFWFVFQSVTAVCFYLLGIFTRKFKFITNLSQNKMYDFFAFLLFLLLLLSTFNLNPSAVCVKHMEYGNYLLFCLSAFAGIFTTIFLSKIIPPNKLTKYLGKNTLILLGLNDVFCCFINSDVGKLVSNSFPEAYLFNFNFTVIAIIVIGLNFLLCYPFIYYIRKFFPFFIGERSA